MNIAAVTCVWIPVVAIVDKGSFFFLRAIDDEAWGSESPWWRKCALRTPTVLISVTEWTCGRTDGQGESSLENLATAAAVTTKHRKAPACTGLLFKIKHSRHHYDTARLYTGDRLPPLHSNRQFFFLRSVSPVHCFKSIIATTDLNAWHWSSLGAVSFKERKAWH